MAKQTKKKKATQRYYVVRINNEIQVYRSSSIPRLVPLDWYVADGKGRTLDSITELCTEAAPLFKDLAEGEIREMTVNLSEKK